jgi:hypothetical protein
MESKNTTPTKVRLEQMDKLRRLHIGSYFVDLNESDYQELLRIFSPTQSKQGEQSYCPTCGSKVKVESSGEGTGYFVPVGEQVTAEESWQTINANKERYLSSTNLFTKAMPKSWIELWQQVEIWYGDVKERETAEQLLQRIIPRLIDSATSLRVQEAMKEYLTKQRSKTMG